GHRIAPQSGPWREQARLARDALDLSLLLRRHIGNDKVLVWRDAEIAVVHLCNRAQRALLRGAGNIAHASVLHEQREVAAAIHPCGPAEAVAGRGERVGFCRRKPDARALLDLGAEGVEPAV